MDTLGPKISAGACDSGRLHHQLPRLRLPLLLWFPGASIANPSQARIAGVPARPSSVSPHGRTLARLCLVAWRPSRRRRRLTLLLPRKDAGLLNPAVRQVAATSISPIATPSDAVLNIEIGHSEGAGVEAAATWTPLAVREKG